MIDEYWTWRFYGYHSDELSYGSGKLIVARCDICCQYRIVKMIDYRDLCMPCARTGKGNSMYGRTGKNAPGYGRRGADSPGWRGGKQTVYCSTCGAPIEVIKSKKESQEHFFCCRECERSYISSRVTEWFKVPANCEKHRAAIKEYYSDPIVHEKRSAKRRGIPYEEWEGFAKNSPYCPLFDKVCRESNREKYGRRCFLCGRREDENVTSTGKHIKLSVHHCDMNKNQGCDGHEWKLVPLCIHCHCGAHNNLVMSRIMYLLEHVWNKE